MALPARAPRGARRRRCRRGARQADVAAGARAVGLRGPARRAPASARSRPRWRSCACSRPLLRDKQIGRHVVPIVPDESRTFGMEGMFRQLGIFSQVGQLYTPEDAEQLMFYREDKKGQILQEGINEAGAFSSWIAAATSYSNHGVPMIPFYIYYSMFGFQRVGDLAWAAGDSRARGFLLGGTAGRTTLNGEGLQHEDGHSHLLSATIPNCVSYDPTYGYEVAVIVQDGLRRMLGRAGGRLLLPHADERELPRTRRCPRAREEGILRGMYLLRGGRAVRGPPRVQLLGSGTILREVLAGGRAAARRTSASRPTSGASRASPSCGATGWRPSAGTCCTRRGAAARLGRRAAGRAPTGRWSRRPTTCARSPTRSGRGCTRRYRVLGTDGFGRSDYRKALRALLRGRPPPRRAGGADARWPPRARSTPRSRARRSSATASTPSGPRRGGCEGGSMAEIREVLVPDIGDFADVPVIEVLVSPGDTVAPEDPLVTLESDKATMEVPAPFAGTVAEIKVSVGDTVSEGSPILTLRGRRPTARSRESPRRRRRRARPVAAAPAESAAAPARAAPASPQAAPTVGEDGAPPYASPGVRRLARELGVDLARGRGHRAQGPHHQGGRARRRRGGPAARGAGRCAGHRAGPRPVAEGRLREVRAGRAPAAARGSRRSAARTWPATG